jgi:sec-independent protein translocase protein TatC
MHQVDSDFDPFASSRMPVGDHLEELRRCLWRAILGYAVAVVLGFLLSRPAYDVIAAPVEQSLDAFYARRLAAQQRKLDAGDSALTQADAPREVSIEVRKSDLHAAVGLPAVDAEDGACCWIELPVRIRPVRWTLATSAGHHAVLRQPRLTALTVTEPFVVYFKVSLVLGLVLGSPWIAYQLWTFVASGLYPHERRLVYLFGPLSLGLFLGGVVLCQFVVLPAGVSYLLGYYEWLDVEPELRLNDWLFLALWTPVIFGLSFQTPLVMLALERIGVFSVDTYRNHRRLAIFLMAVLAAVLTVSPDWFNMLALAVPLWFLYELGIVLCRLASRNDPQPDEEDLDLEEACP